MSFTQPISHPIIPTTVTGGVNSSATDTAITSTNSFSVTSTTAAFSTPIIVLNNGGTGSGIVPSGLGGLNVVRGTAPNAQLYWSDSLGAWEAGTAGNLKQIAEYNTAPVFTGVDLTNGQLQAGSVVYQLPLADGTSAASGCTTNQIQDLTNGQTNITATSGLIDYKVSNTDVMQQTPTTTTMNSELLINNNLAYVPNYVSSNMYFIGPLTSLIYTGSGNATWYLPAVAGSTSMSKFYIIKNNSPNSGILTVAPNSGDDFAGEIVNQILDFGDSMVVYGDGIHSWITH
jgi:hypothetical protein